MAPCEVANEAANEDIAGIGLIYARTMAAGGTDRVASVVTFLMGDLVDSTRNWQLEPERMSSALEWHDRVVGDAVHEAGGSLFKHTGDGFIAQFDDPDAALDAARRIRDVLGRVEPASQPFVRARLAIDSGWASSRAGDWFGPTLNRLARVTDVASADGVVVTGAARALMRSGGDAVMLGAVSLRGHDTPTELFGLGGANIADASRMSRLPRPLSDFVGRAAELASLRAMLEVHRLVSIVGAGGAGKTRLAVELARGIDAPGVGFVDLVAADDGDSVARQLALGAGVDTGLVGAAADAVAVGRQTGRAIGADETILVIDNCEHVRSSLGWQLEQLLDECPGLRLITTSRVPIEVEGEFVWQIPPLETSEDLFRSRAASYGVTLDETEEVAEAIARVCHQLDGLPLAVEIAAARLVDRGLGELADEVDLVGPGRSVEARRSPRRTMMGVVRGSHDSLSPAEQKTFRRLALIDGEFRRADVGLVDDDPGASDRLEALTRTSLLTVERRGLDVSFRMLEPVRQAARQLLVDSGELDETMAQLVGALRAAAEVGYGVGFWEWATVDRLRPLLPTVWAAVAWLDENGDQLGVLRLVADFAGVAVMYSGGGRALDLMAARIELGRSLPDEEYAVVLVAFGLAGIGTTRIEMTTAAVVALLQLELPGDCAPLVFAHRTAALGAMNTAFLGRHADLGAREWLEKSRALLERTESRYEHAAVAVFESWADLLAGRWEAALQTAQDGEASIDADNVWGLVLTANRGMALLRLDQPEEALALATSNPHLGHYTYWGDMLGYVEVLALAQLERESETSSALSGAIRRVLDSTHPGHRGDLVLVAAWVAVHEGRTADAQALTGEVRTFRGPHTLQLVRGLEEAAGVRMALEGFTPGADMASAETHLDRVLTAELSRLDAAASAL